MEVRSVDCPSSEVMRALDSGKLDEATAEAVLTHLETCPKCRHAVGGLSIDTLIHRLRAAQSSERSRQETPSSGGTTGGGSSRAGRAR